MESQLQESGLLESRLRYGKRLVGVAAARERLFGVATAGERLVEIADFDR